MKVVEKTAFFSELKKICRPEMGYIPKSVVVEAFEKVSFDIQKKEQVFCPTQDCSCPYYKNGICTIKNPMEECDDFASCYIE